jgi:hypothetical protein
LTFEEEINCSAGLREPIILEVWPDREEELEKINPWKDSEVPFA